MPALAMSRMQDTLKRAAGIPGQLIKSKTGLSAQELIKMPNATIKFGVVRKKPKISFHGKWHRRFIVLLKDNIYIYKDELAPFPKEQYLLQCFNQVRRAESEAHEWCFAVVPDDALKNMEIKIFACISEEERLDWMRAVRDQLCLAHGLNENELASCRRSRNRTAGDEEYDLLEEVILNKRASLCDAYCSSGSVDYNSGSDESSSGISSISAPSSSPATRSACDPPPKRKPATLPKPGKSPTNTEETRPLDGNRSSKYINIETELAGEDDDTYDFPVFDNNLEQFCTVADSSLDRDVLIAQLKATGTPGTYAIRKSRKGDDKVLALLAPDDTVREYKVQTIGDRVTLDRIQTFHDVESLLHYYSAERSLPKSPHFLQRGLYAPNPCPLTR
ncbi:hypothetical protein Btru_031743 [Bulinus truncatus]|nr:hypothetical protein Btru_031743 [Bulinus truncatus]